MTDRDEVFDEMKADNRRARAREQQTSEAKLADALKKLEEISKRQNMSKMAHPNTGQLIREYPEDSKAEPDLVDIFEIELRDTLARVGYQQRINMIPEDVQITSSFTETEIVLKVNPVSEHGKLLMKLLREQVITYELKKG